MNYRIALLTHGPDAIAADALQSFLSKLTEPPCDVVVWGDGPKTKWPLEMIQHRVGFFNEDYKAGVSVHVAAADKQEGFCTATRRLWKLASTLPRPESGGLKLVDHVLWLEHDFLLLRELDLNPLASILAQHRIYGGAPVAQVSLMRGPVSDAEREAGGLVQSRPGEFGEEGRWLSQRSYFTTNVNLMTVDFMLNNPWPQYDSECEGKFTRDLLARGYRFGVWGDGQPWIDHLGVRSGFGY